MSDLTHRADCSASGTEAVHAWVLDPRTGSGFGLCEHHYRRHEFLLRAKGWLVELVGEQAGVTT